MDVEQFRKEMIEDIGSQLRADLEVKRSDWRATRKTSINSGVPLQPNLDDEFQEFTCALEEFLKYIGKRDLVCDAAHVYELLDSSDEQFKQWLDNPTALPLGS